MATHEDGDQDPRVARFRLQRLKESLSQLRTTRERTSSTSPANLGISFLWGVGGFFGCALAVAIVCVLIFKMDSKTPAYEAIIGCTSLAAGVVVACLLSTRRTNRFRKEALELEERLQREVDDFVQAFPETFRSLFESRAELLIPERLTHAIAFLRERTGDARAPVAAKVPSGEPPGLAAPVAPCSGQVIGGCRLVRKIGEGGMGSAYEARHLGLDIPVVVKVLRPELTRQGASVERFVQEARAAAKVKHPNIVGVYNVGSETGIHFIVMELVEGGSLQDTLKRERWLSPACAVKLIGDVCRGLQCAHEHQIVHRDIKPANVLLDAHGMAKIADLGLAKRLDEDFAMTQTGTIMGTPYYMSPEQAADARHVDHRTDIYSLGCMFYEMVCGTVPFAGDTLARIIHAHARAPIPDPRVRNPEVSEHLANVISKMMAKSPADRFQSAKHVLDELPL